MINSVSSVNAGSNQPKISGKTHNRSCELQTLRDALNVGHDGMISALSKQDYEAYGYWSDMIDNTQARIDRIIDKEDGRSIQKVDNYDKISKTTLNNIDGTISVADHAIGTAEHAVDAAVKTVGNAAKMNLIV